MYIQVHIHYAGINNKQHRKLCAMWSFISIFCLKVYDLSPEELKSQFNQEVQTLKR